MAWRYEVHPKPYPYTPYNPYNFECNRVHCYPETQAWHHHSPSPYAYQRGVVQQYNNPFHGSNRAEWIVPKATANYPYPSQEPTIQCKEKHLANPPKEQPQINDEEVNALLRRCLTLIDEIKKPASLTRKPSKEVPPVSISLISEYGEGVLGAAPAAKEAPSHAIQVLSMGKCLVHQEEQPAHVQTGTTKGRTTPRILAKAQADLAVPAKGHVLELAREPPDKWNVLGLLKEPSKISDKKEPRLNEEKSQLWSLPLTFGAATKEEPMGLILTVTRPLYEDPYLIPKTAYPQNILVDWINPNCEPSLLRGKTSDQPQDLERSRAEQRRGQVSLKSQ